ncbi:zf-HC2 domain-containing protein [Archangium lipolyticum]|uniref:zf-HC2 domain-containing protein n=1 Tax=Archangium lipolyticum TaxID=2970465 RepID=UPI00214A7412|nr:zf-HC2 domain-containing protein [Archangium lipolyticum]
MSAPHPSFLALDRAAAGDMTEEIRAHLASCPRCAGHVDAMGRPPPVPSWVTSLADEPRRPSPLLRWVPWGAGALAAVLALVLWVPRGLEETPSPMTGIRAKGGPAVALYVKHGDSVRLWDGTSPVAPGDLLRLKVMPEGFTWLTVAAPEGGSWQVLHEGPLSAQGETLLPTSWRVEPGDQPERLLVVLGHEPLAPESLSRLDTEAPRTTEVWVLPLTLTQTSVP